MSNQEETHDVAKGSSSEPASGNRNSAKGALRWWLPAIILVLMGLLRILPIVIESPSLPVMMLGMMGPTIAATLLFAWWIFFSRTPMRERLLGCVGLLGIASLTIGFAHASMHGMPAFMYQFPTGMAAFAIPLVILARLPSVRLSVALFVALLGFGGWDLLRFEGVNGEFSAAFSARWSPSAEEEYLKYLETREGSSESQAAADFDPTTSIDSQSAQWPSFRGRDRNNVVAEVVLKPDWDEQPPELVWKRLIGPGWSSFSIAGKRLFTQEQRGESEAVVCLDAETGNTIWEYVYPGRFEESIGGAGPRATPTIGDNRLYCLGADGAVICLDPVDGKLIWQRDLREDADRGPPIWGWSSSPLVVDSKVIVHAGGADSKGVIAYDATTGDVCWSVASGDHSYSSAELAEFSGETGILMVSNDGLQFLSVQDGHTIWQHEQESENYRVLQPLVTGNVVLYADSMGDGTHRLTVSRSNDEWQVEKDWSSRFMKAQYNDFVLHQGQIYGFDGSIFASIDLQTGEQNWKRGRYGNGQVLLLSEEGQLLVTSEKGEIVLVRADPSELMEVAKFSAIEGKTWNHPVLVGDRLYLRNGQEAACYRLPLEEFED